MWTAVGSALAAFGAYWLLPDRAWLLLPAVALGLLKARFILRRAADATSGRIRERGDGRCIGGFLSVRSWLFVILMAVMGRLLRSAPIPRAVVGFLYVAVGVALLVACGRLWGALREVKHEL